MKKLAIFMAAMVLSLSLVACGGSNNSDSNVQSGGGSYQEGYDKGYRDGYQEAKQENGGDANSSGGNDANSNGGTASGDAMGDTMGGAGNAVGDAVAGVGDAVGDMLGGSSTNSTTGTTDNARSAGAQRSVNSGMAGRRANGSDSTFQRMLDNARVTDTDGFIEE